MVRRAGRPVSGSVRALDALVERWSRLLPGTHRSRGRHRVASGDLGRGGPEWEYQQTRGCRGVASIPLLISCREGSDLRSPAGENCCCSRDSGSRAGGGRSHCPFPCDGGVGQLERRRPEASCG